MGQVTIYTDGSAVNKTNSKGGYGIVLINGSVRKFIGGSFYNTTSARMELRGVIEGLKKCKPGESVVVWCDNQYVVNTLEKGWLFRWNIQKWRNRANVDLLKQLLAQWTRLERRVKFKWLRGHDGHEWNEEADRLASFGANREVQVMDLELEELLKQKNRKK